MAIYKLIRNTVVEPKDIERLVAAYKQTLRAMRLKDRDDLSRSLSPRRSLRLAGWELKYPAEISRLTLKELGLG